jgi:AcrR family transcriptional regulator
LTGLIRVYYNEYILTELLLIMKTLRRIEQKEQTRRNLIKTSLHVFSDQGITSTKTAELAKHAKVSHGTIFLHFPKREDLIFAVMNEFGDQLAFKFDEAAKDSKGVAGILKAHLQTLGEFEGFYTHLIKEICYLPDKVKSRLFILQSSISHRINIEAQKEMAAGKIKNIDRPMLFNTWIALLHYYITNKEIFSPNQSVISSVGDDLLKHFLNLIKSEV